MKNEIILKYPKVNRLDVDDILSLIHSSRFLAGCNEPTSKTFALEDVNGEKEECISWCVRPAIDFIDAIRVNRNSDEDDTLPTPWDVLHKSELPALNTACANIGFYSVGRYGRSESDAYELLEEALDQSAAITKLSKSIAKATGVKAKTLYNETLAETPLSHFGLIIRVRSVLQHPCVPLCDAIYDAYDSGLMPYGIVDSECDEDHIGPPIIVCINPTDLS